MSNTIKKLKIVVVGGGAGGLELVTQLGRSLGKKNKAAIYLIDKEPSHVWKPLLHEIAAGMRNTQQEAIKYGSHAKKNGYNFEQGDMIGLNQKQKSIILQASGNSQHKTIKYDYLILSIGSQTNTFNVPGADKHCYFLNDSLNAAQVRTMLQNKTAAHKHKEFSIAIIGGGPTGIELAASIQTSLQPTINNQAAQPAKVSIIEAGPRILPLLPAKISHQIQTKLNKMGINIYTSERVTSVHKCYVSTHNGFTLNANLIIWVAGIKAPNWLGQLDGLAVNKINQLIVKPTLQTSLDESIFALGDCSSFQQADGLILPARAQTAHQQAALLAKSIREIVNGKKPLRYQHKDYGSLINLAYQHTFGVLTGPFSLSLKIKGILARFIYISLYKMHQFKIYSFSTWVKLVIREVVHKCNTHNSNMISY